MQENARWQAVLELISAVFEDTRPADNIINEYFRSRKYIGSSDRRFISEQIWNIIRNRRKLEFDAKNVDARRILMAYVKDDAYKVFAGGKYAPYPLSVNEEEWLEEMLNQVQHDGIIYPLDVECETPKWLFEKIKNPSLCKALNNKAPADFRINAENRETVIRKLKGEGLDFEPTPYSPIGIRSVERVNLNNCIVFQEGLIDVQDEASQIASILCDVKPQDKVIDYCAGAGGKALTISYLLQNKGNIFVHDINWERLEAIKDRAERLKATNIEIIKQLADDDLYDKFIIDAPCSGTGTWRRSPDAKFRLTLEQLKNLNKSQAQILDFAYDHLKPEGRIVYITCSVLRDEDESIIEKFLHKHKKMRLVNIKEIWERKINQPYVGESENYLRLSPLTTNTDGFFMAVLSK